MNTGKFIDAGTHVQMAPFDSSVIYEWNKKQPIQSIAVSVGPNCTKVNIDDTIGSEKRLDAVITFGQFLHLSSGQIFFIISEDKI